MHGRCHGHADDGHAFMQVSWDDLDAGLVVITVAGYNIPFGPQLYSLVVQGSFTGQLESTYNPAWNGVTSTMCSLPVARISSAPAVLSNSLTPTFVFATTSTAATAGFQCKLSGSGGTTTAVTPGKPLQDWTTCTSPAIFTFTGSGTYDGTYLFQVRATSMSHLLTQHLLAQHRPSCRSWHCCFLAVLSYTSFWYIDFSMCTQI